MDENVDKCDMIKFEDLWQIIEESTAIAAPPNSDGFYSQEELKTVDDPAQEDFANVYSWMDDLWPTSDENTLRTSRDKDL